MRRFTWGDFVVMQVVILAGCLGIACALPTEPTAQAAQPEVHYTPLHHNIPASWAQHPEGPIIWLCATQPRLVCESTTTPSRCQREEDHYLQTERCPAVPIE